MTTADVSVIVTTYTERRWECLVDALASLRRQTLAPREVIVVVDHNPKLLSRVRDEMRDEMGDVLAVESRHPPGLAGARNAGLAVARGTVVAFLDDDAEAWPDWLERLLSTYSDGRVVGVGGSIEPQWQARRPEWLPEELDWVVGCSYAGLPTRVASVRNLIGCNMSFRREPALGIGGFRTGFGRVGAVPLGCEETEFCIRLRQRWPDQVLIHQPRARVAHQVPAERGRLRYLARRCYSEGLSKAQVARSLGSQDGLSTERSYVLRTLPRAVVRGLAESARGEGPGGLKRSAAVISALLLTAGGYCHGRLRHSLASSGRWQAAVSAGPISAAGRSRRPS